MVFCKKFPQETRDVFIYTLTHAKAKTIGHLYQHINTPLLEVKDCILKPQSRARFGKEINVRVKI